MNIQVLPHVFKKFSLILFIVGIMIPMTYGFLNPFNPEDMPEKYSTLMNSAFLLGIIIYFLSKERIEDELVKKLRSDAFSITFLLSAILLLVEYIFSSGHTYATTFLALQIIIFLIIFYLKKRSFDL